MAGHTGSMHNTASMKKTISVHHPNTVFSDISKPCTVEAILLPAIHPLPVPMALESVHAGFPSVAQDYFAGDFSFDQHVIPHPDTTFIVTIAGDSMQGAGIWDGDLLVVDRSLEPQEGDVVVAVLDGELTVKRLLLNKGNPVLHPENPHYPDFIAADAQSLLIWGVVTGNYHRQSRTTRSGVSMHGVSRPGMEEHVQGPTSNKGSIPPNQGAYPHEGWDL